MDWVERLYRGVARNCPEPFRFIVWTDRLRTYREPVEQRPLRSAKPSYGDCVQPFEASDEAPMILMGLDSMVTGDLTPLIRYAQTEQVLALPRDPYYPERACNGVQLIPQGHGWVWNEWDRRTGDMERCRAVEHRLIDDLFPGLVVSFKCQAKPNGLGDARIVYFHGEEKVSDPAVARLGWIKEHWR